MATEPPAPPAVLAVAPDATANTLRLALSLLHKAVDTLEPRFSLRALRFLPPLRKQFAKEGGDVVLAGLLSDESVFSADSPQKKVLLDYLGNPAVPASMDLDDTPAAPPAKDDASPAGVLTSLAASTTPLKPAPVPVAPLGILPEAKTYLSLLVVLFLLDTKAYSKAQALTEQCIDEAKKWNRRTMDAVSSRVYFYWVRSVELAGGDTGALRSTLLAAQRTSSLHRDDDLQSTLLPLLLRNYLEHKLYDQADRLVSKTTFPAGTAANGNMARWFYYVGRIRAIQLDYSEAHTNLQQAIRRAANPTSAAGFLQTAHKLSLIVELLMGEIPERRLFRQPVLKKALGPYLEIVQAVRIGDIKKFNVALATHSPIFVADKNATLILRLRHNVIKTALRTISLSYSRIPLSDVASKLHLDSEEDAEYIVAKAVRDGVVEAVVDHERGEMSSRGAGDVYATGEPMRQFDERIRFLLELHKTSVKAMRYPLNAHAKELASAGEARERERELVKEIEDADEDPDLEGPGDIDGF